jgi:hypothetical protein
LLLRSSAWFRAKDFAALVMTNQAGGETFNACHHGGIRSNQFCISLKEIERQISSLSAK